MKKHSDYITHISNKEDIPYLKGKHFPVNMRLFRTSVEYKIIILHMCNYIRKLCLEEKEGYKKPHGMSSANAGLAFNIIGIARERGTPRAYCQIMINPTIQEYYGDIEETASNCGSLTLETPIVVQRSQNVRVCWYDEEGNKHCNVFQKENGGFTIQHEVDHNNGILITDRQPAFADD